MDDVVLEPFDEGSQPTPPKVRTRRASLPLIPRIALAVVLLGAAFVLGRASSNHSSGNSVPSTTAPSTTTLSTVTTTTTSTTTTSSVVPGVAGPFAGEWRHHSMSLAIDPSGHGLISFRTYSDCASEPQPCDVIVGSDIYDGGLTTFTITADGNNATGQITSSTDPVAFPTGSFTARYDPSQDLLILEIPGQDPLGMCGPRANDYTADPPCGA